MKDFINEFVSALTMREKAYFKTYAQSSSGNKEKNYLRLFDAIEKMSDFDMEKLKEQFEDEPMSKYLSSEINYLLQQLLKSQINYHFESSPEWRLQKSILSIHILIEKGFQKKAEKMLSQAKKLAYHSEDFTTILKLIQVEEEVLFSEGILGFTDKLLELSEERNSIILKINNLNTLRLMREQIRELQFLDLAVVDYPKHPHFYLHKVINEVHPLSLKAAQHWHHIKNCGYFLIKEYDKAKIVTKEYITFLEMHHHLFKKKNKITAISNHLYNCALTKDKHSFYKTIEGLKKYEEKESNQQQYIDFFKYARELELYYQTNDIEGSKKLMKDIYPFVLQNLENLGASQSNYILFLSIRAYIVSYQYNTALDLLNIWFKHGVLDYTIAFAKLFMLIIYLELGWTQILSSQLDTVYKYLMRKNKYDELSRTLIHFFNRHIKQPNHLLKSVQKLEQELVFIYSNFKLTQDFEYFNYLEWCQDKKKRLENNL